MATSTPNEDLAIVTAEQILQCANNIDNKTANNNRGGLSYLSSASSPTKRFHKRLLEDQHKDISPHEYDPHTYPIMDPMYSTSSSTLADLHQNQQNQKGGEEIAANNAAAEGTTRYKHSHKYNIINSSSRKGNGNTATTATLGSTFSNFFSNSKANTNTNILPESESDPQQIPNENEDMNNANGMVQDQNVVLDPHLPLHTNIQSSSRANTPSEPHRNRSFTFKTTSPYNTTRETGNIKSSNNNNNNQNTDNHFHSQPSSTYDVSERKGVNQMSSADTLLLLNTQENESKTQTSTKPKRTPVLAVGATTTAAIITTAKEVSRSTPRQHQHQRSNSGASIFSAMSLFGGGGTSNGSNGSSREHNNHQNNSENSQNQNQIPLMQKEKETLNSYSTQNFDDDDVFIASLQEAADAKATSSTTPATSAVTSHSNSNSSSLSKSSATASLKSFFGSSNKSKTTKNNSNSTMVKTATTITGSAASTGYLTSNQQRSSVPLTSSGSSVTVTHNAKLNNMKIKVARTMECMNSYMKENTAMQHKIKILEDEINSKILDITSEKRKILDLRQKISRFENNENYLKNEITTLNRKLIDMEYEEGNSDKVKELKKLVDEIGSERDKYIMEVDAMERKLENINEEHEKNLTQNRIELEENFKKSLQESQTQHEKDLEVERKKTIQLEKKLHESQEASASLESLLKIKDNMIQDFNKNLDAKVTAKHNKFKAKSDKEMKRMTLRIRDLTSETKALKKTLTNQEEEMNQTKSDFQSEKIALEKYNTELLNSNKVLLEEVEQLNAEITTTKTEIMAEKLYKEKTISQLREDLKINENRNITLTEELIDSNNKLKECSQIYEDKINILVTQITDLKQQINSKSHFNEFLTIKKDKLEVEKENEQLKANTVQLKKVLSIEKKTCDMIINTTMVGSKLSIVGMDGEREREEEFRNQNGNEDENKNAKVVYTSKSQLEPQQQGSSTTLASMTSIEGEYDDESASLGQSVIDFYEGEEQGKREREEEGEGKIKNEKEIDQTEKSEEAKVIFPSEQFDPEQKQEREQETEPTEDNISTNTGMTSRTSRSQSQSTTTTTSAFGAYVSEKRKEKNFNKHTVLPTSSYVMLDDNDGSTLLHQGNRATNRNSKIKKRLGSRLSFNNNNANIKHIIGDPKQNKIIGKKEYQDEHINQELEK